MRWRSGPRRAAESYDEYIDRRIDKLEFRRRLERDVLGCVYRTVHPVWVSRREGVGVCVGRVLHRL